VTRRLGLGLLLTAALGGVSCTGGPRPSADAAGGGADAGGELTVFAAASLARPLAAVEAAYREEAGVRLITATDSSAALRTQIEQDAPADVFLSADTENPDALFRGGQAAGPPVAFATTRLVLVVPPDNPGRISSPRDLARPGVRIVAAGPRVPITRYAETVVDRLAGLGGFPAGFAESYGANIVSREDNVRAVVTKVALGEGDAAFVYAVDVVASEEIGVVQLPDEANVTAQYAGVVIANRPRVAAARGFLAWLAGPSGQAILADHGFEPPG
jgi:molybdate transport system substrate-binding protein